MDGIAAGSVEAPSGAGRSGRVEMVALSRFSADFLRPYLPAGARFHHLEHMIDVPRLPPVPVAANRAVVCVGRLDEEKGVRLLAEAAGGRLWRGLGTMG